MKNPAILLFPLALLATSSMNGSTGHEANAPAFAGIEQSDTTGLSIAHFAEGCFWCSEEVFGSVQGVSEVVSGYSGGTEADPTYEEVSNGSTGHAESVEVYYDPKVISYATLVKIFFASQDPTTESRQGPDAGSQYRSIAFYDTPEQKAIIDAEIKAINASGEYSSPVVTQVVPFVKFWRAEEYHQDFVKRNPNNPYVLGVSKPRFENFKEKMPQVVK
ncbi:MAG: peptide-methionine (S)-S-oxide reductase MsrA [Flavobacteriales bacterium]